MSQNLGKKNNTVYKLVLTGGKLEFIHSHASTRVDIRGSGLQGGPVSISHLFPFFRMNCLMQSGSLHKLYMYPLNIVPRNEA